MLSHSELDQRILTHAANAASERGLLSLTTPVRDDPNELRFEAILDGDIPAVIEVFGWRCDECHIRVGLWPKCPAAECFIDPNTHGNHSAKVETLGWLLRWTPTPMFDRFPDEPIYCEKGVRGRMELLPKAPLSADLVGRMAA